MIPASLCIPCKGRLWCGLSSCPILEKFETKQKSVLQVKGKKFEGSSPPSVFVSWKNYPNISIAPLSPPEVSDTALLDNPEKWFGMASNEIVRMRSSLIQPKKKMRAQTASDPSAELSSMQELALSEKPVSAEFELFDAPKASLSFHESTAPMGPFALLKKISLSENPKIPRKAEYFFSDTDAKSSTATQELYEKGFPVHYLSKILSAGTLGVQKQRKLVPTRWSITAIDSNVSKFIIENTIKDFQQTGEFELFTESYLGNSFFVLFCPDAWSFEMLECWLPGAGWALFAEKSEVNVVCDFEFYDGCTTYADNVTGAYYAARLAVAEHLARRKRQATAIVFREISDDYTVPLGVWVIRETMRKALEKKPLSFSSLDLAIGYAKAHLKVPMEKYLAASKVLDSLKKQKKISEWLK